LFLSLKDFIIMKFSVVVIASCVIFGLVSDAIDTSGLTPVPMHSFRPPYSTGRAGIRGWNYGGDVTIFQDYIRLTQDQQSQIGYIWNKNALSIKDWEATLSVKIDGKGRLGGDGIAFWYVAQPNAEGKAFGAPDQWKGLGVFIDTFDNDNKRDNPSISVIVNDGTRIYNPQFDGKDMEIGGCRAGFRKTSKPAILRVTYIGSQKKLVVAYDISGANQWHECFSGTVDLPAGYYLGISAATGGVSDAQDVNYFELRRLDIDDANTQQQGQGVYSEKWLNDQEKNEKDMDNLKQELDSLRKMDSTANANENAKKPSVPADDIPGRLGLLDEQLKDMETKLAAVTKVASGIDAVSNSIEQLKMRIDSSQPTPTYDVSQLKNELNKQKQELDRIASKAKEEISYALSDRLASMEQTLKNLQTRADEVSLATKKTGSIMNTVMIVVMVAESCILLFVFMKGRNNSNKYDKMW